MQDNTQSSPQPNDQETYQELEQATERLNAAFAAARRDGNANIPNEGLTFHWSMQMFAKHGYPKKPDYVVEID